MERHEGALRRPFSCSDLFLHFCMKQGFECFAEPRLQKLKEKEDKCAGEKSGERPEENEQARKNKLGAVMRNGRKLKPVHLHEVEQRAAHELIENQNGSVGRRKRVHQNAARRVRKSRRARMQYVVIHRDGEKKRAGKEEACYGQQPEVPP